MYKLIVNNKGVIIIDKTLSKDECESIKHNSAQWIVNAFKKYINIRPTDYKSSLLLFLRPRWTFKLANFRVPTNCTSSILFGRCYLVLGSIYVVAYAKSIV